MIRKQKPRRASDPARLKRKYALIQAHFNILPHSQEKHLAILPSVSNFENGTNNPAKYRYKDEPIPLGVQRDKTLEKRTNNLALPVFPIRHRNEVVSPQFFLHLLNPPGITVQAKTYRGLL